MELSHKARTRKWERYITLSFPELPVHLRQRGVDTKCRGSYGMKDKAMCTKMVPLASRASLHLVEPVGSEIVQYPDSSFFSRIVGMSEYWIPISVATFLNNMVCNMRLKQELSNSRIGHCKSKIFRSASKVF